MRVCVSVIPFTCVGDWGHLFRFFVGTGVTDSHLSIARLDGILGIREEHGFVCVQYFE